MTDASVLASNIAAIYVESFLYGLYFILSMASIYLILKHDGDRSTVSAAPTSIFRRPMLLGTILLFFIISTVCSYSLLLSTCKNPHLKIVGQHWVITFVRFFQAFIYYRGGREPEVFFNSLIEVTQIMQVGFFLAGLVISDTLFVSHV